MMTKIGFIGLGNMGYPMASRLLEAGFPLSVFDVLPERMALLEAKGAVRANSPVTLAKTVDVLFSSLQTSEQVKQLCMGESGIFAEAKSNLLFIDCSSIDIDATRLLHQAAIDQGVAMLDSPVSGGVAAAKAGTLTLMVGGDKACFERASPFLSVIGKKIVHAGPGGHGQAAKICNNLLLAISMIGVAEAFSLAQKLALAPAH